MRINLFYIITTLVSLIIKKIRINKFLILKNLSLKTMYISKL